jgi:hypothetical protein
MTLARFESVNLDPMSTLPLRREGITGEWQIIQRVLHSKYDKTKGDFEWVMYTRTYGRLKKIIIYEPGIRQCGVKH